MRRGGGRIQLVYVGVEDAFLTGNPKLSFFRFIYRRYTNFSMESIRMYFNGKPDFGQIIDCVVPRFGDLLGSCFMIVDLPKLFLPDGTEVGYCNNIGDALIEEIKVLIGETEIDKHTGVWEDIWGSLTTPKEMKFGYQDMIGEIDGNPTVTIRGPYRVYIPLTFWFNRNPGMYLPLLALQYHQVRFRVKIRPLQQMFYTTDLYESGCTLQVQPTVGGSTQPTQITNMEIWGDYIFLDNQERRTFVSQPHEYLIDQVQTIAPISITAQQQQISIPLVLNHPLKEIVWVFRRNIMEQWHEWFNYTNQGANEVASEADLMLTAVLQIDGQNRFDARSAEYFRLIQPYQYHTANPNKKYIYLYSFALTPEKQQPSGTLNASRFDSIVLQVTTNTAVDPFRKENRGPMTCFAFATNYNVLKIQDGFGGLMFAN